MVSKCDNGSRPDNNGWLVVYDNYGDLVPGITLDTKSVRS
jgi:hypothetical protein